MFIELKNFPCQMVFCKKLFLIAKFNRQKKLYMIHEYKVSVLILLLNQSQLRLRKGKIKRQNQY